MYVSCKINLLSIIKKKKIMKDSDKLLIAAMSVEDLDALLGHLCDSVNIMRKYTESIVDSDYLLRLTLTQIHVFEELRRKKANSHD